MLNFDKRPVTDIREHHQRIHIPFAGMPDAGPQPPHYLEPEALPDPYRPVVGAHHEVELHGAESARPSRLQRMRAHRPRQPAARCPPGGHIPAVGHVRPAALLIGVQEVSSRDLAVEFGDENLMTLAEPILERLFA